MKKTYLIGVDLGTSATKAALYSAEGALVAESSQEVPLYYPCPGVVEQENGDFYTTAAQTVRACIQRSGIDPRQVAAIAFDSQMAGVGSAAAQRIQAGEIGRPIEYRSSAQSRRRRWSLGCGWGAGWNALVPGRAPGDPQRDPGPGSSWPGWSKERVMWAAVYHGPNDLRVEDVAVPEIGVGEILLKVDCAGVCCSRRSQIPKNCPGSLI